MLGCQPKKGPVPYATGSYPYGLAVQVDNEQIEVSWKRHGDALISGYNIYVSETPVVGEYGDADYPEPLNLTVFPGDTEPEDGIEHYEAKGLTNGKKYWVSVRVVNPDRSLSKSTVELMAVPAPTGEIGLVPRYKGDRDGYSFWHDRIVQADATENDVYYYFRDGKHFLASPTRLDGFLRQSHLMVLPYRGGFKEVLAKALAGKEKPEQDRIEIGEGDWILMSTADSRYVLLQVLEFAGTDDNPEVRLFFAVSGLQDTIHF